jgi:hypothetical protein
MDRRGYAIAFVAILLLACLGGFIGGRFLLQRFQSDALRPGWVPPTATAPLVGEGETPAHNSQTVAAAATEAAVTAAPQPRRTATVLVVATPVGAAPLPTATETPQTAGAVPTAVTTPLIDANLEITVTVEFTGTVTVTPGADGLASLPFVLARPIRNSAGDCPGSYVLGQVTDRSGSPLPDIRLLLVDEFGNSSTVISKPGPADKGLYDFPVTGPPRRFTLAIVDESGQPLSERVPIEHQVGSEPDATCHWADWQRR